MNRSGLVLSALIALCSCNEAGQCLDEEPAGVFLRFERPDALSDFFAHPWPSDARLTDDGRLRLRSFPNPTSSSVLTDYLATITDNTRGFGKNGSIYMSFSGKLDISSLPTTPLASLDPGSSLYLVDIDPDSPEYGKRIAVDRRFREDPTLYLPANSLSVLPPYGLPLRDATTYALIVTDGVMTESGPLESSKELNNAMNEACEDKADPELFSLLAPLRAFFADREEERARVRGATVFTTQDVIGELEKIVQVADAQPVPEVVNLAYGDVKDHSFMATAEIQMPAIQEGEVPYTSPEDGGGIAWGPDGLPMVTHTERTRISFIVPWGIPMPESGWPVVVYSHGTGGSYTSVFNAKVADVLGQLGVALIGYDQNLHGPRDPTGADPDLTFFNLFNIVAGRDNVRQGTVDLTVMTNLIRSGIELPSEVTVEGPARFDPNRVAFMGHSQGGLAGAPFVALEPDIKAAVFSGTSGVLAITVLERKDPVDFLALLRTLLELPDEEIVDEMHPVITFLQTFIEAADPINYSPHYARRPPPGSRRDVLFVEGFLDYYSPARGHEALAAAAGAPLISPHHRNPLVSDLLGLAPQDAPVQENVDTPEGPITMGLIQYPEDTHYPVFDNPDANRRYAEFLRSALYDGRAQIIAPMQ